MNSCKSTDAKNSYIDFYSNNRCKISDLYPSEKKFNRIDFKGKSILDVGCACGGFYNIFKAIAPDINYFGIDISEKFIKIAKNKYPEIADNFFVGSATDMPFADKSFDIVFCGSVQAHCSQYECLFLECWRVSKQTLFFDFRFSLYKETHDLNDQKIPYIVLNINRICDLIKSLEGVKHISLESYQIVPNKNEVINLKVVDTSDIWCGLFLLIK